MDCSPSLINFQRACLGQALPFSLPPTPGLKGLQIPSLILSCCYLNNPPALETWAPEGPSQSRAMGITSEATLPYLSWR